MEYFKTLNEAIPKAVEFSVKHPDLYVTLFSCFGIGISAKKRLDTFAPSDSIVKFYWKAGKQKPFTTAQIVKDQVNTPVMS